MNMNMDEEIDDMEMMLPGPPQVNLIIVGDPFPNNH
jgi:hypothetical protein